MELLPGFPLPLAEHRDPEALGTVRTMWQKELGFLHDHKKEIPHRTGAPTWDAKYVKPLLFGGYLLQI